MRTGSSGSFTNSPTGSRAWVDFTAGDIDGDGHIEFVTGGFWYRPDTTELGVIATGDFSVETRLADPAGRSWYRTTLDDRFEHHDGTKVVELAPGRLGIVSHAWQEANYVHLWQPPHKH